MGKDTVMGGQQSKGAGDFDQFYLCYEDKGADSVSSMWSLDADIKGLIASSKSETNSSPTGSVISLIAY